MGTLQICAKLCHWEVRRGMRVSNFQPIVRDPSVVKDLEMLKLKFNEKFCCKNYIVFNNIVLKLFLGNFVLVQWLSTSDYSHLLMAIGLQLKTCLQLQICFQLFLQILDTSFLCNQAKRNAFSYLLSLNSVLKFLQLQEA